MYIVTPIKYDEAMERARDGKPVYFIHCYYDLDYLKVDEQMLMSMPAIDEFDSNTCWSSGFDEIETGNAVDLPAGRHIFTFNEPKPIEDSEELLKWMWKVEKERGK